MTIDERCYGYEPAATQLRELRTERDEARHEATEAHGVAQALERQVWSLTDELAVLRLPAQNYPRTLVRAERAEADRDRLRALLTKHGISHDEDAK